MNQKDNPNLERVPFRQYAALLSQYLRPQWFRVTFLAVFMFGGIGLNLVNPQIIRYFIDTAREGGTLRNLYIAGGIYLAIGFVRQLVMLVSSYLGAGCRMARHESDARGSRQPLLTPRYVLPP